MVYVGSYDKKLYAVTTADSTSLWSVSAESMCIHVPHDENKVEQVVEHTYFCSSSSPPPSSSQPGPQVAVTYSDDDDFPYIPVVLMGTVSIVLVVLGGFIAIRGILQPLASSSRRLQGNYRYYNKSPEEYVQRSQTFTKVVPNRMKDLL